MANVEQGQRIDVVRVATDFVSESVDVYVADTYGRIFDFDAEYFAAPSYEGMVKYQEAKKELDAEFERLNRNCWDEEEETVIYLDHKRMERESRIDRRHSRGLNTRYSDPTEYGDGAA